MSAVLDYQPSRFVRQTTLQPDEYRKNFRQIDRDVIEALTSSEAKSVTYLMSAVYLTLIDAPSECWEREGVLRFSGEAKEEGESCTAWQQLVALLGCGNSTAKKALKWMHEQTLIGYFAGKNGVGIRIFINRAAASIGKRGEQKNLRLLPAPASESRTPTVGAPFKDRILEVLDTNKEFRAPENGANQPPVLNELSPDPVPNPACNRLDNEKRKVGEAQFLAQNVLSANSIDEVVGRLRRELEPCVKAAAVQAAVREHERTREWLEKYGLPKAARVAQRETYNLFKHQTSTTNARERAPAEAELKQFVPSALPQIRLCSTEEIAEAAEMCAALLEAQGKPIDETLAEITLPDGWLLPEDAPRVRQAIERLRHAESPASG